MLYELALASNMIHGEAISRPLVEGYDKCTMLDDVVNWTTIELEPLNQYEAPNTITPWDVDRDRNFNRDRLKERCWMVGFANA